MDLLCDGQNLAIFIIDFAIQVKAIVDDVRDIEMTDDFLAALRRQALELHLDLHGGTPDLIVVPKFGAEEQRGCHSVENDRARPQRRVITSNRVMCVCSDASLPR